MSKFTVPEFPLPGSVKFNGTEYILKHVMSDNKKINPVLSYSESNMPHTHNWQVGVYTANPNSPDSFATFICVCGSYKRILLTEDES